ncbi:MAG TPA: hypothetical protein VGD99_14655 [Anaerolineae bacterium]
MSISYTFRHFNGEIINDPIHQDSKWLTGVTFGSTWPGGYAALSGQLKRDALKAFRWGPNDEILVHDGATELYRGRIETQSANVTAFNNRFAADGWISSLDREHVRWRWQDVNGVMRLDWPTDSSVYNLLIQQLGLVEKRGNTFKMAIARDDFNFGTVSAGERGHWEEYRNPPGNTVKRVTFVFEKILGEILEIRLIDGDGNVQWSDLTAGTVPATAVDVTFSPQTSNLFRFEIRAANDILDQNDWFVLTDLVVYSETNQSQSGIIRKTLDLAGTYISSDYSLVQIPNQNLAPFLTKNDSYQSGLSIIKEVLEYGDILYRDYGFQVWGSGSSDGLPLPEVAFRSTADPEWIIDPRRQGVSVNLRESPLKNIFNWIAIRYINNRGVITHLSPDDYPQLANQDSITEFGRGVKTLDLGEISVSLALNAAQRFLNRWAWPRVQGSISVQGYVQDSQHNERRSSRIRAGQALTYLPTGENLFISEAKYSVEKDTMEMSIDEPSNYLTRLMEQKKFGMELSIPRVGGFDGS